MGGADREQKNIGRSRARGEIGKRDRGRRENRKGGQGEVRRGKKGGKT